MTKRFLPMARPLLLALILGLAGGSPSPASAQSVGTSLSGPATADGASPYYNPAAMGAGRGTHLELDGGLVALSLGYAHAPSAFSLAYAPGEEPGTSSTSALGPLVTLGGFTDALHPDWRVGLSVSIPRTSGGNWARDDGAAQITRYFLVSGATFHISAIPAVSWSPTEWITIGLGANLVYGSVSSELDKDFGSQLNQTAGAEVFPYAHPDLAAPVTLSGDGFGVGAIAGVLVRPIPEFSIGAAVHTPTIIAGGGSLDVSYPDRLRDFVAATLPTATLPDLAATIGVDLDIPTIFILGASGRPHEMLEIAGNYQFEHSSSQPNFNIRVSEATSDSIGDSAKPQAYTDRHRFFLRAAVLPIPTLRIAIHGAFQTNIIPNSTIAPNNIDFDRVEVGLALRWRVIDELSLMAQYSHLFLLDRVVTESLHRPITEPGFDAFNHPSPTGTYTGAADTIRIGVALHFDDGPPAVEELDEEPPPPFDEEPPSEFGEEPPPSSGEEPPAEPGEELPSEFGEDSGPSAD